MHGIEWDDKKDPNNFAVVYFMFTFIFLVSKTSVCLRLWSFGAQMHKSHCGPNRHIIFFFIVSSVWRLFTYFRISFHAETIYIFGHCQMNTIAMNFNVNCREFDVGQSDIFPFWFRSIGKYLLQIDVQATKWIEQIYEISFLSYSIFLVHIGNFQSCCTERRECNMINQFEKSKNQIIINDRYLSNITVGKLSEILHLRNRMICTCRTKWKSTCLTSTYR